MGAFSKDPVSTSQAAFEASFEARPLIPACDCPDCKQKLGNLEVGIMAERLAVTQDWLTALREYRSKNDLEFLQGQSGQNTEYVTRLRLLHSAMLTTFRPVTSQVGNTFSKLAHIEATAHRRSSPDCKCSILTTLQHLQKTIWRLVRSSKHGRRGQSYHRKIQ